MLRCAWDSNVGQKTFYIHFLSFVRCFRFYPFNFIQQGFLNRSCPASFFVIFVFSTFHSKKALHKLLTGFKLGSVDAASNCSAIHVTAIAV